jgi:DNA-binding CsgD family transcriptional regulator
MALATWSAERCRREVVRLAHSGLEQGALWKEAAALLGHAVQSDGGCWHTHDPATLLITSHYTNLSGEGFAFICRNEYLEDDVNKFSALARTRSRVSTLTEATRGQPEASARFRTIYGPRGWGSELRATFGADGSTWGSVMLLRERGRPDFSAVELRLVASLSGHFAHAIRSAALRGSSAGSDDAPGVALMNRSGEIEALTPAAERWLAELADEPRSGVPAPILSVANRARTADTDPEAGAARSRVLARSGRWLVLHASLVDERADGRVAVIVEPARPAEVAPLIVEAYGLTARERDVLQRVVRGLSTKQIAAELVVTPNTVQDHLKSIFEKTGVRRRSELAGRLFYDHLAPELHV